MEIEALNFYMITSLPDRSACQWAHWVKGLWRAWKAVGLNWASTLLVSQNSRFRAPGKRQTGRASDVAGQLLFQNLGTQSCNYTQSYSILLASLVFFWTYIVFEYNDDWKKVLFSSHIQNDLLPCCYSLRERSQSMTCQLSHTSSISHFWCRYWSAEISEHVILKKDLLIEQLLHLQRLVLGSTWPTELLQITMCFVLPMFQDSADTAGLKLL